MKTVLLAAKDGQAPGTALLAGGLGQQGASILPTLRGLCRRFVQSQEITCGPQAGWGLNS